MTLLLDYMDIYQKIHNSPKLRTRISLYNPTCYNRILGMYFLITLFICIVRNEVEPVL